MIAAAMLLVQSLQHPAGPAPYWQQRLEYDITATLDERRGVLGGTQRVVYHNNSPDTLRTVSLHLYLNAFRPGSRWSDVDSIEHRRRFNDLMDPDFGFNRISDVEIEGQRVTAVYPFAPDSTIVRFTLPRAVLPGQQFTMAMGWEARPSTVPRRQGRRGRAYDFAQWYPRVVAYDKHGWAEHPLYPAGEFYGDFGDFRVTLDVPEDQVVGATGVPVCGDPGWERANQKPARPVEYRRDAYGAPRCDELGAAAPGRKRMVWDAREVHHFAISMNPQYRYEGGRFREVLVHALYKPGDERTWPDSAVKHTETALAWLDGLFGPYPWPQMTNVHRIDGGGTEFPMMMHNGSAGLGLILHEGGHNYLMGILANNEWREGFLDEGFTSFQTTWFMETRGQRTGYPLTERTLLLSDLDGWSEPTSLVSEEYRDFQTYNAMIYNRGELFYHQLRTIVGDSTMRAILRTYYQRWKLKHVDEAAFRAVAEEVSKRDLSTFFAQWLHSTVLYDHAIGKVKIASGALPPRDDNTARNDGGGYTTRVEVVRKAPGIFPVDVVVRSRTDSAMVRTTGAAEREWVELTTEGKPTEVEVDPRAVAHDWNVLNNRKVRGLLGFASRPRREWYFDTWFSKEGRRDRLTIGAAPAVWYNSYAGLVLGARLRTDYLGRFEQNEAWLTVDTRPLGKSEARAPRGFGFDIKFRNPVKLQQPRTTQLLEGYWVEGRAGAVVSAERQVNQHRQFGAQTWTGAGLRWLVTTDTHYLDPALWDGGGTIEGSVWRRSSEKRGPWQVAGKVSAGGGFEYRNQGLGLSTDNSYDAQPFVRLLAEASARRTLNRDWGLGFRGYGGWVESGRRPLKQRQLFVSGADPYEQFSNPLLRSRGSLLARADENYQVPGGGVYYQMPGGGGVRGVLPGTTATRLLAVNAELDRRVFFQDTLRYTAAQRLRHTRFFEEIRVALFSDAAFGNGDIPRAGSGASLVADAGIGIRMAHRIGQTPFITRFDFPLLVTRPRLAVYDAEGVVRFRWVMSFSPAF